MKPHIKVFITKSRVFRAVIDNRDNTPSFEVTVGGNEWYEGKGREYEIEIIKKCEDLLFELEDKLNEVRMNL